MIYAWHFINECGVAYGGYMPPTDRREVYDGSLELCASGFHASRRIIDALQYGEPIVRRVVCSGEILEDDDKLVCSQRKELWRYDCTAVLREFGCQCAERALSRVDKPDQRSIAVIEVVRRWAKGEATDEELNAARTAAWAAEGAAWDAARDAARDARAAAWAAARIAVWDAEGAANAEINWQNKTLHRMVLDARGAHCAS